LDTSTLAARFALLLQPPHHPLHHRPAVLHVAVHALLLHLRANASLVLHFFPQISRASLFRATHSEDMAAHPLYLLLPAAFLLLLVAASASQEDGAVAEAIAHI
jgi:hypothetical protein